MSLVLPAKKKTWYHWGRLVYYVKKALSAPLVHELWLIHAGDDSRLQWAEMEQDKAMAITSQQFCGHESVSKCSQYYTVLFP